jgi:AcrR family transcriptional regulator
MYESKDYSLSQIKTATGIGATTLYRYLDKKKDIWQGVVA